MKVEHCFILFACLVLLIPAIFRMFKKEFSSTTFKILLLIVACSLASIIALRIAKYGVPILRNIFDILIIISFLISIGFQFSLIRDSQFQVIATLFLLVLILCSMPLSSVTAKTKYLPPVLKSLYFYLHIPAYIIAYALLLIAFAVSIYTYCLPARYVQYSTHISQLMKASFWFMNLGIIFGALWAEQAWGSFWAWDIKENFSLAILLSQSLYFHSEEKRKISFLIIVLTTLLVFINLFGVNFVKRGLHAY